ncbi:D-alanyl-D-alanine carboxypeptidase family protein [Erythrobacter sp. GH1-10]|uniref:D-alanyl-D-alanine carboxypeptidase family protein n=1 Tax=Erythrobacter sp. GH1-10 TaxID=3349334 RepID=UPI003877DCE0
MIFRLAALLALAMPTAAYSQTATGYGAPGENEAPIAFLIDVSSGQVLFERNADRRFIPASMTKAMTIYLAFELIEQGRLDPGQVMTVREDTWREWAGKGSTMFLPADARVRVDDLIAAIANVSANDGSIVLAEGQAGTVDAWVEEMNRHARLLGMTNSHFGTPNGWPDEGRTFTSARDLARLGEALVEQHPKKFARYVGRAGFTFNGITQPNRDPIIGRVRGADGIKTGFTNEAGFGFLGTAQRGGQRLVMVVAGIDRTAARARVSRRFIEWGFEAFERQRLFVDGALVGRARVQGGDARSVELATERTVFVNVPKGQVRAMTINIVYDGPLRAPIEAGENIARLEILVPGMEPAIVPLVASEAVNRAGFFRRIFNGIAGWLT